MEGEEENIFLETSLTSHPPPLSPRPSAAGSLLSKQTVRTPGLAGTSWDLVGARWGRGGAHLEFNSDLSV